MQEQKFKEGDRVRRKNSPGDGTIVEITHDNRCKIKWDYLNGTGQQHSTVKPQSLMLIPKT